MTLNIQNTNILIRGNAQVAVKTGQTHDQVRHQWGTVMAVENTEGEPEAQKTGQFE